MYSQNIDTSMTINHWPLFCLFLLMFLVSGWKLNPVVSAVYSPEFYAGRRTFASSSVTIFVISLVSLIHFVRQHLWHLHFLHHPKPPPLDFNLHHLSLFSSLEQHTTRQCLFIAWELCWVTQMYQQFVISAENQTNILQAPTPPTSCLQYWPAQYSPTPNFDHCSSPPPPPLFSH